MNNLLQQIQDTHRPSTRSVAGCSVTRVEWKSSDGEFHQGEPNTPHVRLDRIFGALDTFWSHISRCANKGIRDRVDQFSRDTKVTQFDVSSGVNEDIGGFDVAVHNSMGFVKIVKPAEDGFCNLSKYIYPYRTKVFRYTIQGAVMVERRQPIGSLG